MFGPILPHAIFINVITQMQRGINVGMHSRCFIGIEISGGIIGARNHSKANLVNIAFRQGARVSKGRAQTIRGRKPVNIACASGQPTRIHFGDKVVLRRDDIFAAGNKRTEALIQSHFPRQRHGLAVFALCPAPQNNPVLQRVTRSHPV